MITTLSPFGVPGKSYNFSATGDVAGDAAGTSSVTGTLSGTGTLAGSSAGASTVGGVLSGAGSLAGSAAGTASVTGSLQLPSGQTSGSANGSSTATGTLYGSASVAGSTAGSASVSGTLEIAPSNIIGSAQGSCSVSGTLSGLGYITGSASGLSSASLVTPEEVETEDSVPMLSAGIWRKNQPNTILFVLTDTSGNEVTGLGGSFTLQISKGGGAFAAGAGVKSEVGLGWYKYVSTAGEANTSGPVALVVTHDSIAQQNLEYVVEDRVVSAIEYTYTLTNSSNSSPISGANVSFSTNSNPANSVWSGITDAFGVARDLNGNLPRLTPGSYSIFVYKPGFVFENPDTEVVS